jgi:uncharacterized protein (DUF427 family)
MTERAIKKPGPDHPITVTPNPDRVVVSLGGKIIADTREALSLVEGHYAAVQYIPRKDVDMSLLQRSDHTTYCSYKGEANYFHIPHGGEKSVNAIWTYETPYDWLSEIKEHVAFYPDRVDSIAIEPAAAS